MLNFDKPTFYAYIRRSPFGGRLTPQQVDGIEQLLDAWDRYGPSALHVNRGSPRLDMLSYVLAGVHHETGGRMVPVREGFASTDAGARKAVAKLFDAGKISVNYALPVNGLSYYGRGRIQNTWLDNYKALSQRFNVPLVENPDLLLTDGALDARVTVVGHLEGIWTKGKHTLARYFPEGVSADPVGARHIVNGTDKAQLVATYYQAFFDALTEARRVYEVAQLAAIKEVGHPQDVDEPMIADKAIEARPDDVKPSDAKPDAPDLKKDPVTIGTLLAGIGGAGTLAPFMQYLNNPWAFAFMGLLAVGALLIITGRLDLKYKKGA